MLIFKGALVIKDYVGFVFVFVQTVVIGPADSNAGSGKKVWKMKFFPG